MKPDGFLQTSGFETIAVDLFGLIPKTNLGHRWIFIVQDVTWKWVELSTLGSATATACAIVFFKEGSQIKQRTAKISAGSSKEAN